MPELRSTIWVDNGLSRYVESNTMPDEHSLLVENHPKTQRWHVMLSLLNVWVTLLKWSYVQLSMCYPKFDGVPFTEWTSEQTCTMCFIFPTLSQTKPRKDPRLQCAFNDQVLVVFCNSHWLSQLAAIFFDKRAEWSTVYSCMFQLFLFDLRWNQGNVVKHYFD